MSVTLPWPHKDLSPNSRKRHRHMTAIRRAYKETCWALARGAGLRGNHLTITFHPPCGRKRDLDNCLFSIKYGLDGVALAMGVDDSTFTLTIRKAEPVRPDGCVVIEASETERPETVLEHRNGSDLKRP